MTQRRMLANASFRLSDSNVTHDVSGRSQGSGTTTLEVSSIPELPPSVPETSIS
jgi:hypothetical protein